MSNILDTLISMRRRMVVLPRITVTVIPETRLRCGDAFGFCFYSKSFSKRAQIPR